MEKIINIEINDPKWELLSLPCQLGDVGILQAPKLAMSAYLSSLCGSLDLCDQSQNVYVDQITWSLEAWKLNVSEQTKVPPRLSVQRKLTMPLMQYQASQFSEKNPEENTRLQGLMCLGAGDWLNALPFRALCLQLDDEEFRIAMGFRLGAPVCTTHKCSCGEMVDTLGKHSLVYKKSRSVHARQYTLPTVDTKRHAESFFPHQFSCGTKGGAESAAHAVQAFLKDASDGAVLLKLDLKNAFNSIRRDIIAEKHADKMPELTSFFNLCYGNASFLSFGDFILDSVEGAQQDDPLAVFYFCLAMNEMLIELISIFKSGYIDDITLGDKNIEAVLDDLKTVLAHGEKIGIELNQKNKSELIVITSEKRKEILAQLRENFPYIA